MKLFDNSSHDLDIPKGCPWHSAQQTYGAPNVNWCEPSHCSWVDEPANTWSNLSFLIIAFIIIKSFTNMHIKVFGLVVLLMGAFSGLYHATNNFLSQNFDFIGMAIMTAFILAFETTRVLPKIKNFFSLFWFYLALNSILLLFLNAANIALQNLLLMNILPILVSEIYCGFRDKTFKTYHYFWAASFVIALAQYCAQVDLKRIHCNPENLFLHGHVFWHLLSSLAMLLIAKHMDSHWPRLKSK